MQRCGGDLRHVSPHDKVWKTEEKIISLKDSSTTPLDLLMLQCLWPWNQGFVTHLGNWSIRKAVESTGLSSNSSSSLTGFMSSCKGVNLTMLSLLTYQIGLIIVPVSRVVRSKRDNPMSAASTKWMLAITVTSCFKKFPQNVRIPSVLHYYL